MHARVRAFSSLDGADNDSNFAFVERDTLQSIENAVLDREADGNPIGKDSAITSLALPGIKLIDAYLARLVDRVRAQPAVGRAVKLFLDEAEFPVESITRSNSAHNGNAGAPASPRALKVDLC